MKASIDRPEAINLLKEVGCHPDVIKHCELVSDLAVKIALSCKEKGIDVDVKLVEVGALLHDVGRSRTHAIDHGIVGAKIARSKGLSPRIVSIIENHVLAGISSSEATTFSLPTKDYLPSTLEEKIVVYADKKVSGSKVVGLEKSIESFSTWLGKDHPVVLRLKRLQREIQPYDPEIKYKER